MRGVTECQVRARFKAGASNAGEQARSLSLEKKSQEMRFYGLGVLLIVGIILSFIYAVFYYLPAVNVKVASALGRALVLDPSCPARSRLTFVNYEPSKAEEEWGRRLRMLDMDAEHCPAFTVSPFKEWTQAWITGSLAAEKVVKFDDAAASSFLSTVKAAGVVNATDVFSVFRELFPGAYVVALQPSPRSVPLHRLQGLV